MGGHVESLEVKCPDCNGTGEYRGLEKVEVCATCHGERVIVNHPAPMEATLPSFPIAELAAPLCANSFVSALMGVGKVMRAGEKLEPGQLVALSDDGVVALRSKADGLKYVRDLPSVRYNRAIVHISDRAMVRLLQEALRGNARLETSNQLLYSVFYHGGPEVVRVWYEQAACCWAMIIDHPLLEPVAPGAMLPVIDVIR